MAYVKPVKLTNPFITLSTTGATPVTVDLTCYARGLHLMGEENDALATFCDPLGYDWLLTIDLLQSLGDEGLDTLLWSLGGPGTVVDFQFAYMKMEPGPQVGSADNPLWEGQVRLAAWPIVDAGINEPTEINLEMDVIGDITRTPVQAVAMATAQSGYAA